MAVTLSNLRVISRNDLISTGSRKLNNNNKWSNHQSSIQQPTLSSFTASSTFACLRDETTTLAPSSPSFLAIARPMLGEFY